MVNGTMAYVFYYASTGNYEQLKFHLRPLWAHTRQYGALSLLVIPSIAMLVAASGHKERAAECLGLGFTHPMAPIRMFEQWKALTEFRVTLQQELGTEAYNSAWQRGKGLDLETVVQELLDEFGEDD